MLVSKKNRKAIFSYLFQEGVCVAKKDYKIEHPEIEVPNLEVINLMKSLKSRGFVRESYAWQHFYWYLTDEGIDYLREFLHLPAEVMPETLKRSGPSGERRPEGPRRREGGDWRGRGGDRSGGYRRREEGEGEKKGLGAGGDFRPRFGGAGRGAPPPTR